MKVFSPDHFSNSKPLWETLHSEKCKKLHPIIAAFINNVNFKNLRIEFSGGLEINSKNFKVIDKNSIYLFKKWDSIADVDTIKRTIEINIYLLKKGEKVKVCVGKDKGKSGEIIEINRSRNLAKVKAVNMLKKHKKATKENKGGIITKEGFIHLSNLKKMEATKGKSKK